MLDSLTHGAANSLGTFGVVRPRAFDHNHWREEMGRGTVQTIQRTPDCRVFMKRMQYDKIIMP